MADGNLRLEASANFGRLEQAIERLQRKNATLEDRIKRMGDAQGRATSKGEKGFAGMLSRAAKVITAYTGIHNIIQLVNSAIEEQVQLNRRATEASATLADAARIVGFQTFGFTQLERAQFMQRMIEVGQREGLTAAEVLGLAAPTLSATLDDEAQVRIDKSVGAVETLLQAIGDPIKSMPSLPGAILDLQRSLGETATLQEAAKFAGIAQSIARFESPEQLPNLIRTIAAAVAGLSDVPDDMKRVIAQETLAMFAAFQAISGDVIGANTSTAIVNFLAQAIKETGRSDLTPELLRKFIADSDVDIKYKGKGFSTLLQPEFVDEFSDLSRTTENALRAIQAASENQEEFNRLVAFQQGEFSSAIAGTRGVRRTEATVENLIRELGGAGAQAAEIARKNLRVPFIGTAMDPMTVPRRAILTGLLELHPRKQMLAESIAREQLREMALRRGGIWDYLPGLGLARTLAGRQFTDEHLLAIRSKDPAQQKRIEAAQQELRDLIALREAADREAAIREQLEAQERKKDNAKLVDNVSRSVDSATQIQRRGSEQEN